MVLTADSRKKLVTNAPDVRARGAVKPWEIVVLAAYAAVMIFALAHHERWFDEAQAWLLARDASVRDLLLRYPRYEGSPPLWQLLLALPAKLGAPYWSMPALSGIVAFAGAVLIVRRAPFPPVLRALLPFGYWWFFQYGVVARSYVLLGPLLWLLAITWPRRFEHPVRLTTLCVALSLVSVHGFLIAGTLMALHAVDVLRRRAHPAVLAVFAVVSALLVLELRTPADVSLHSSFHGGPGEAVSVARAMTTGAFSNRIVVLAAVALTVGWLWWRRRLLVWLAPTAALVALFAFRYGTVWHQGMLVEIWLFALWISFGDDGDLLPDSRGMPPWLPAVVVAAMSVVLSVELVWTVKTVHYDASHSYSAAARTAAYLKTIGAPGIVIRTPSAEVTAIQPYFTSNPFSNVNDGHCPCFWWWSKRFPFDKPVAHLTSGHPDAIVFGDKVAGHGRARSQPVIPGYHAVRHFSGALYIRNKLFESEGFWVFVPDVARP
ncbi:MAG: hypothetical protein QOK28_1370 [Actinomycetota bacterium]|jgi:hypothetical protein